MRKLLKELDELKRSEKHISILNNRLDYNGFFLSMAGGPQLQ